MDKRLLRITEVVEALGLSRSEVYRAIARGELATVKFGRAVRVAAEDLDIFIAKKRDEAKEVKT